MNNFIKNKKIKKQYKRVVEVSLLCKDSAAHYFYYIDILSGTHKKFSKVNEKSFAQMHLIEYKMFPLKIRAKRNGGLADCWDDYNSTVCNHAKSWKANSKRRKQYYNLK